MSTTDRIDTKRQRLDQLRHSISQTLGPPRNMHGTALGLIFAGLALGVMAERWGIKPLAARLISLNKLAGFIIP